jgi:hypothetical protein
MSRRLGSSYFPFGEYYFLRETNNKKIGENRNTDWSYLVLFFLWFTLDSKRGRTVGRVI